MRRNLYILWLFMLVGCTEEKIVTAPPTDHQPPVVAWHEPAPNAELSGEIDLIFSASDPSGVTRISVFRNGLNPPDWTFTPAPQDTIHRLIWNTSDDSDGLYILEVRAWDEAGNLGISPSLLVRVRNNPEPPPDDRTPPDLWWEFPEGGATLKDTVVLRLRWFDESGVDSVAVWRNGRRSAVFNVLGVEGVQDIFWDTVQDSDGVYLWEARGWDAAGNEGRSSGLLVRVQNHQMPREDHNPPVITWVSPESGSELSGVVTLRFQILDDISVDSVRVFKNGRSPERFYLPGHSELDYELGWSTTDGADGVYLLEVRAWDAAGNLGVSPGLVVTVANNLPADRTPPDVWWLSPIPGATLRDTLTLRLRAFDENGVNSIRLYLDGLYRGSCLLVGEDWVYWWNTPADSDGVHLWEARAWDVAGNEGRSSGLLVRVQNRERPPEGDRTPPQIVWRAPQPGDTLEGLVTLRLDALDDDRVDSLAINISGARPLAIGLPGQDDLGYAAQWDTREHPDGVYTLWARAWDRSQNLGFSEPLSVTVWNNRPRVIWVPDEFETIQGAIIASRDGDTVRVRAGTYHDGVRLLGRKIFLESEEGPEVTVIDAAGWNDGIKIHNSEHFLTTTVRGFTIYGEVTAVQTYENSSVTITNCIFHGRVSGNNWMIGIWLGGGDAYIYNCVFDSCRIGFSAGYVGGRVVNSIFIRCEIGYRRYAVWENWVNHDYNLFWANGQDYQYEPDRGENDVFQDPRFVEGTYLLSENSPAIDSGDPEIVDRDNSRSDIGVYGGPYAYTNP